MIEVIFLDAVGTLFDVRGSVGQAYAKIAKRFGVEASEEVLNREFFRSFASATPMAFPGADLASIPELEFEWWHQIAVQTFKNSGVFDQFPDFAKFFAALYEYFTSGEPWFVYPDVKLTLEKWKNQDITLAVLSNFDSRIYPVLKALDLASYFSSVTISTEAGAAKPDAKIFTTALDKHNCSATTVLHIGDSFKADYQGAKALGMKAIWLNREGEENGQRSQPLIPKSEQYSRLDLVQFE